MAASPLVVFAITQIFYFLALVVRPSPYRFLFMIPIVLTTIYYFTYALRYHTPSEYAISCTMIAQLFQASNHILLTDVQRELSQKGQKVPAFRLPFIDRVKWAASLYVNWRGIGWAHEPTHALPHRPAASMTRSQFVVQEIPKLVLEILLYEAATTYTKGHPCFTRDGYSIAHDGFLWCMVNVFTLAIIIGVAIDRPYRMLGILSVALGFMEPHERVPLYGSLADAYTLQNFWGRVWHQLLRWQGASHGKFVAYNVLHLRRKSLSSFLVQLFVGFAVTGLIHVSGEYALLGRLTFGHALRFYLMQAVGITVETLVVRFAKKLSVSSRWCWVGYLWVAVWFTVMVPAWAEPMLREGMVEETRDSLNYWMYGHSVPSGE